MRKYKPEKPVVRWTYAKEYEKIFTEEGFPYEITLDKLFDAIKNTDLSKVKIIADGNKIWFSRLETAEEYNVRLTEYNKELAEYEEWLNKELKELNEE